MSNFIEKAPNVSIENPVHFLPGDSHPERIQRIVRASPRSEPIREPKKILFVNLIEDRHHCMLDDLVLQRSDPQRTLSSIRLGNVGSLLAALRLHAHDSGPGWLAKPYLYDSFIRNFTPVYPGALQNSPFSG